MGTRSKAFGMRRGTANVRERISAGAHRSESGERLPANRLAGGVARMLLGVLTCAAAASCDAVSYESDEIVTTLRVLGVRSEPASVTPGSTSELTVLCADGKRDVPGSPACSVEVAWINACHNPPGASATRCLERFGQLATALSDPIATTPANPAIDEVFGMGNRFVFHAPADILTSKVDLGGVPIRYGISYVFFAVCAGTLHPVAGVTDRLPFECRDALTGQRLGQSRFVIGHTTVYSYDAIQNSNPAIESILFDGAPIVATVCSEDTACPDTFLCRRGTCVPRVRFCGPGAGRDCVRTHKFEARVSLESFNIQPLVPLPREIPQDAGPPPDSIWIRYYANSGELGDRRATLDPASYANENLPASWRPAQSPDPEAHLWAVVRDDRGGLSWAEQIVVVE